MLTAGVMGPWARFRYILVTPALLHSLHPEALEAVIAQDPALIVVAASGADSTKDNIADLQAIAPTIVVDYSDGTWEDTTLKLAEAAGLTDQAEVTIADFEAHVSDVAGKITVPEGKANIVS